MKSISNIFMSKIEIIFHKTFDVIINKGRFYDNLFDELSKISNNDIMVENDQSNNLILSAKELISKLLLNNKLSKDNLKITIKLSFIYDKPFYFILVDDENKFYLNNSKHIIFEKSIKKNM